MTEGPDAGQEFDIDQAAILGRLKSNDIPVQDVNASREHAKIYKQGSQFAIVDLNSTNGTMVNGQKITKRVLKEGDVIGIGVVHMRYELLDDEKPKDTGAKRMSLDEAFSKKSDGGGAKAAAGAGGGTPEIVMSGHKPLQFSRVKSGKPLVGFDLEQVSSEARLLIFIAGIAIFAGLVWLTMTLVSGGPPS